MGGEFFPLVLLVGATGGYIGGVVGGGMGAITVPCLMLLGVEPTGAVSSSLLLHVIIAPLGGAAHYKFGHVRTKIFALLALAGVLGVFLGARASAELPSVVLKPLIGILAIGGGGLIATKFPQKNPSLTVGLKPNSLVLVPAIALSTGVLYGISGMWGTIGVPLLILAGVSPHVAVGSSLLARFIVASAGTSAHHFFNGAQVGVILPLLIGGAVGIIIGAFTSKWFSSKKLKLVVGATAIVFGTLVLVKG